MLSNLHDATNELYKEGYLAGLMQTAAKNTAIDYIRGYNDAMVDLCDFEPENCC